MRETSFRWRKCEHLRLVWDQIKVEVWKPKHQTRDVWFFSTCTCDFHCERLRFTFSTKNKCCHCCDCWRFSDLFDWITEVSLRCAAWLFVSTMQMSTATFKVLWLLMQNNFLLQLVHLNICEYQSRHFASIRPLTMRWGQNSKSIRFPCCSSHRCPAENRITHVQSNRNDFTFWWSLHKLMEWNRSN